MDGLIFVVNVLMGCCQSPILIEIFKDDKIFSLQSGGCRAEISSP